LKEQQVFEARGEEIGEEKVPASSERRQWESTHGGRHARGKHANLKAFRVLGPCLGGGLLVAVKKTKMGRELCKGGSRCERLKQGKRILCPKEGSIGEPAAEKKKLGKGEGEVTIKKQFGTM